MEFVTKYWYLVAGIIVVVSLLIVGPMGRRRYGIQALSNGEAIRLINHEHAVVLDVRENDEFRAGHIRDAVHAPLGGLMADLPRLAKHRERPIIVCCRTSNRSGRAAVMLRQQEFPTVHILGGGMTGWESDGLPVVK